MTTYGKKGERSGGQNIKREIIKDQSLVSSTGEYY
jgi:hypothetical protein